MYTNMKLEELRLYLRIELNTQEKHILMFDRKEDPYSYGHAEGWLMCLEHIENILNKDNKEVENLNE